MENFIDELLVDICNFEKMINDHFSLEDIYDFVFIVLDKIKKSNLKDTEKCNYDYLFSTCLTIYRLHYDRINEELTSYFLDSELKGYFYRMKIIALKYYLGDYFEKKFEFDHELKPNLGEKYKLKSTQKFLSKYQNGLDIVRKKFAVMDLYIYGKHDYKVDENLAFNGDINELLYNPIINGIDFNSRCRVRKISDSLNINK